MIGSRLRILFVCLCSNSFSVQILGCLSLPGTFHEACLGFCFKSQGYIVLWSHPSPLRLPWRGARHLCLCSWFLILIPFCCFHSASNFFSSPGKSLIVTVRHISSCPLGLLEYIWHSGSLSFGGLGDIVRPTGHLFTSGQI